MCKLWNKNLKIYGVCFEVNVDFLNKSHKILSFCEMHKNGQNTFQGFILHLSNHLFLYLQQYMSVLSLLLLFYLLISSHFEAQQKKKESFHKNGFKVKLKKT